MDDPIKKKQVGFRLDEALVGCLEFIAAKYPRLTLTDIYDLALKMFVKNALAGSNEESKAWLDQSIGSYLRGDFDSLTHHIQTLIERELKETHAKEKAVKVLNKRPKLFSND